MRGRVRTGMLESQIPFPGEACLSRAAGGMCRGAFGLAGGSGRAAWIAGAVERGR